MYLTPKRKAIIAVIFAILPVERNTAEQSYRLGIFPYMAPRQTIEFFGPVANGMATALEVPVKLESVPSFTDFSRAMSQKTYDIALIPPFDYPEVVDKLGYIPLAQMQVPLVTQIFVRNDSQIEKIEDLMGAVIALPPAQAANSRMTLRALYDNSIVPGKDVEIRYFNSHDSCIQQVWVGTADACGTAKPPVTVFEHRMNAKLRPIYDTPPLPHILFVAHPRVPADRRVRMQSFITGLNSTDAGRIILKNLGFPGFVDAKPADYKVMRDFDKNMAFSSSKSVNTNSELRFGVFPYVAPRLIAKIVAPTLPALSNATHMKVELNTTSSLGRFMDSVASSTYDLVMIQPFEYSKAVEAGYVPLAGMKDYLQGTFFVREGSSFHQPADLKGQRIAMPPPESAQARLGRDTLSRAGLDPQTEVQIDYHPNHQACMQALQTASAAACFTATIIPQMLPIELISGTRTFGLSSRIPGVLFLAHRRIPEPLRAKIRSEIISWKDREDGRRILSSLAFGEFVPVNASAYEAIPRLKDRP